MQKNLVFRGCTRPAMFLGIPTTPFFIGVGGIIILAMYAGNLLLLFLVIPVMFIMRMMARKDEMIFRLLGLRLMIAPRVRNKRERDGMWVFSANPYRDRPAPKKK